MAPENSIDTNMTTPTGIQIHTTPGVPWIHPVEWEEILQHTQERCNKLGDSKEEVIEYIDTIVTLYQRLDTSLNSLCGATCPTCRDVCCSIATVWYDQRDILTYYLATHSLPDRQISRDGAGNCSHLGDEGCRLPRLERPFICTWYICKAQTAILRKTGFKHGKNIQKHIQQIKEIRKKIELLCQ